MALSGRWYGEAERQLLTKADLEANRYRTDRSASRRLEEFLGAEGLLLTARIPERDIYSDLARDGLTVFDRTNKTAVGQQQAWLPLVRAVEMSLRKSDQSDE